MSYFKINRFANGLKFVVDKIRDVQIFGVNKLWSNSSILNSELN